MELLARIKELEDLQAALETRLRAAADAAGLIIVDWFDSPITGGDGNREFFFHAIRRPGGVTDHSES